MIIIDLIIGLSWNENRYNCAIFIIDYFIKKVIIILKKDI